MFGIGPSELVIVGLLFLVIFGPSKLPQMARDAGRLMGEARRAMDDFKEELTAAGEEDEEDRKPAKKTSKSRPKSRAAKSTESSDTADDAPKAGRVSDDEEEYDL
ncbi:MAG: twin-arginine translocase TatA/TatE family subunit [Rubrobacteraceae bacterium]